MTKFEDAYQSGECEDCERDCTLCHEEGVCLMDATLKVRVEIGYIGGTITAIYDNEQDCKNEVFSARLISGRYIKVQDYYVNVNNIQWIRMDKKYAE